MAGQVRSGLLLTSVLLLTLGCWGESFRACKGEACTVSTADGASGTNSLGGGAGSGAGGSASSDGTGTSSAGGASSVGGASGVTDGTGGSMGEGGVAGDPGLGGSAGAGGSPPECDGALLPEDDLCVVSEEYGVFVSPAGDDTTGAGTREAPFATLQKGADVASESGKRVYACATIGDYDAGLVLDAAHAGLEMYGSFACADWTTASALRASVAPEAGVPLRVSGIETSLDLVGFEFASADATEVGASSIAAEIRGSSGVVLRNVALLAGAGATGARGEAAPFTFPDKSVLDGVDGTEEERGQMSPVECPAGDTTQGGSGGTTTLHDGSTGSPNYVGPGGEGGLDGDSCSNGEPGVDGAEGSPGEGAATVGVLSNGSWLPATGGDGGSGLPGQGGGGGSGDTTGGGGSGGAGGCGGAGGGGGGGGGASIALLLLDAEVALIDSLVAASDAGDGGNGSGLQSGQSVSGSPGAGFAEACPGGSGGRGGDGGPGGGGAGGISVGILLQDASTVQTNTNVTGGSAGVGGNGGVGLSKFGVRGFAKAELDVADL